MAKRWTPVISTASVVLFFIWGYLDSFEHSWISFLIAGLAMAILRALDNKDSDNKTKESIEGENSNEE